MMLHIARCERHMNEMRRNINGEGAGQAMERAHLAVRAPQHASDRSEVPLRGRRNGQRKASSCTRTRRQDCELTLHSTTFGCALTRLGSKRRTCKPSSDVARERAT